MKIQCSAMAFVALAALALPAPALAHWAFTRWDMTPEQVMAASRSALRSDPGGYGDRILKQDRRPSGPVQFEGRAYQAEFYFSDEGKLTLVRLTLKDQTQCGTVMAALTARYGKSSNQYHGEWTDPRTGDRVFQSKESRYGPCHTTYNKGGLPTSIY
jgi:hypothetical protein